MTPNRRNMELVTLIHQPKKYVDKKGEKNKVDENTSVGIKGDHHAADERTSGRKKEDNIDDEILSITKEEENQADGNKGFSNVDRNTKTTRVSWYQGDNMKSPQDSKSAVEGVESTCSSEEQGEVSSSRESPRRVEHLPRRWPIFESQPGL